MENDINKCPELPFKNCSPIPDPIIPPKCPPPCPPGEKGEKGDQGKEGPPGEKGNSAYEVARKNGFKGTEEEWLRSLEGRDGVDGKDGKDAFENSIRPPIYIVPPFNKGKFVTLNDAQMMMYDSINKLYYQYGLLNLDANINFKTKDDNTRIGGGTEVGYWSSKDLITWEYKGIWLKKPENVTSILSGGGIFWENEYWFYHTIDRGEGGKIVGLWKTDSLSKIPEYFGEVLENKNMGTFRDPKLTVDNEGMRMVIAVDGGIGVYRSKDGYDWQYRSTLLIPNLGLIECPQVINTAKYGWLMIFGGNAFATGGTTGTFISQIKIADDVITETSRNRCDMGPDCYAGSLFEDTNGGLIISYWVNSWDYFPNLLVDKINGYIKVARVEKFSIDGNPVNDKFAVQPQKNLYTVLNKTLESNVTLTGDYSDLPVKYLPDNCILEFDVGGDLETGEYVELTHGSTSGFRIKKTDNGFSISRADYGLRPVFDIKNWNKIYDFNFENHGKVKITIEKAGPITTVYIDDYVIAGTFLCYYPAHAPMLHYHGIRIFGEDGNIKHESKHSAFFKMFYKDLIRGTDGSLTNLEVEGISAKSVQDAITTFESGTEHKVRQITYDENEGIAVRQRLGTNINDVPKGQKGVLVHPKREPMLIETQDDDEHLFLEKIIIDIQTGYITLKGKNKEFSGYLSSESTMKDFIKSFGDNRVEALETDKTGFITIHTGSGKFTGRLLSSSTGEDFIKKDKSNPFDFIGEKERQIFIGREGKDGATGWLGEQQDIVYSTKDNKHLRVKWITIDKTTGFISFTDVNGDGIEGYLNADTLPDVIRSFNDQYHMLIKRIGINDDAFITFAGANGKEIKGSLVTDNTMKYVIRSTADWVIEQLKYNQKTREISLIGPEGTITWKIADTSIPPISSLTIKMIDYDSILDRFTVTKNDGTQVFWSRFITKIEVIE